MLLLTIVTSDSFSGRQTFDNIGSHITQERAIQLAFETRLR